MQRLTYYLLRIFIFIFSLVPFRVLYWLSDGLRFLFYYVIKYRYKVIKSNLELAFSEKSAEEIQQLIWDTYGNLCDVLFEGIKGLSLDGKECTRRYKFLNPEVLDDIYDSKRSVFIVACHYGNWEWGPQAIGLQIKHHTLGITAPIKNPHVDHYIQNSRVFEKVSTVRMKETAKAFEDFKDRLTAYVFIMDQSPSNTKRAQWVDFLGQKTACLHGADYYARKTGYPVVFFEQQRVRRGFYEVTLHVLEEQPKRCSEGKITELYMRKLEEIILRKPADWLWSHRRWKHSSTRS